MQASKIRSSMRAAGFVSNVIIGAAMLGTVGFTAWAFAGTLDSSLPSEVLMEDLTGSCASQTSIDNRTNQIVGHPCYNANADVTSEEVRAEGIKVAIADLKAATNNNATCEGEAGFTATTIPTHLIVQFANNGLDTAVHVVPFNEDTYEQALQGEFWTLSKCTTS